MAVEYRGSEFLYLVEIEDDSSTSNFRLFNQTDGNTTSDADEIELDTKDKSGSDYGSITQTISIEGILTVGDDAIDYIRQAQRNKKLVKILEVNTRKETKEEGMYMISSIDRTFSNGEYATYSIDATLNGAITEGSLTDIPEGAPDGDAEEEEG